MAGAAQTIGWILTIDDTDLNAKLGSISTNVSAVKDTLTSAVSDAISPAVGMLEDLVKLGKDVKLGIETLTSRELWTEIGKVMKDAKPVVDKVHDALTKSKLVKIWEWTKWFLANELEGFKRVFINDIPNALVDVFKIAGFLLGAASNILVGAAALAVILKQIGGPILSGIFKTVKKIATSFLSVGVGLIGGLFKATAKSGMAVVKALTGAFSGLGKFAAKAIGTALGPIYTVMAFLTKGLMKALGPVFSIINEFVGALMFAFQPFIMMFRLLLIPFVYRLLPILMQGVAYIVLQIAGFLKTAAKWWDKWSKEGWAGFWQDVQYLSGQLWEDLKVVAGQFWEWLKTTGWENFKTSAAAAWKALKAAVIGFGEWFSTTAWPEIEKGLLVLFDWLVDVVPKAWNSWQAWVNKTMVPWVMRLRERAIDGLAKSLTVAWDFWKDKVKAAWATIKKAFGSVVDILLIPVRAVGRFMGALLADIGGSLQALGESFAGSRVKPISAAGVGLRDAGSSVAQFGDDLFQASSPEAMAEGGVVTTPTIALVGERGTELVIPVGKRATTPAGAEGAGGGGVQPLDDPLRWFKDMLSNIHAALEQIETNTTDPGWINDADFSGHTNRGEWEQ